ncbi:MAG: TlpA family protein disulfide reductase [Methanomicrobiales archaeon]|nr:TlpA family protein disulfide reductase [Methanomicrobiales archaeon]
MASDRRREGKEDRCLLVAGGGIVLLILLALVMAPGCTTVPGDGTDDSWRTTELTDVRTGEVFSVSRFADRPVLIQTFTITCPVCMQQQEEITRLEQEGSIPFIMIGLDIDPNGDAASLLRYAEQRGYAGRYARSPPDMTRSLVDRFGMGVLSPARAPLILVCPDGTAGLLAPGVKSAGDLSRVLSGCP